MAPWPELGERRVPDKEDNNVGEAVSKVELENTAEIPTQVPVEQNNQVSMPEDKQVLTLDEGQLKALLDEAMTYKNPKDREGKSELFNELLQEAEADESNSKGLIEEIPKNNVPPRRRLTRLQSRDYGVGATSRGGSLQNLHALGMEGRATRNRRSGHSNETLVSARQREGGSLPSNVNGHDIDSIVCPNCSSKAIKQVTEAIVPKPSCYNKSMKPSANGIEVVPCPPIPKEYDYNDRLMNVSPNIGYTKMNHVSLPYTPPSQYFTSSEPSSRFPAALSKDSAEAKVKSLDENGNALLPKPADTNGLPDRKIKRRVKVKNDRNIRDFMSNDVEGFRGGADIDTLMEYIESSSNIFERPKSNKSKTNSNTDSRNNIKVRPKEAESRIMKRRKEKIQRCNSLEEISKTKLEDLTEDSSSEMVNGSTPLLTKTQVTYDDDVDAGQKSSSTDIDSTVQLSTINITEKASSEGFQDSEFLIVTKKHRKKKKRTMVRVGSDDRVCAKPVFSAHDRTLEYRHHHVSSIAPQTLRKSAFSVPPSDKSDSSDLDSVHSLPVSSTTTRTTMGKCSVSGGSTPQASYADIAKTVGSSQDINKTKCIPNCCTDSKPTVLPSPSSLKKDAMTDTTCDNDEEFPPLDIKSVEFLFMTPESVTLRYNKTSAKRVFLNAIPYKTVITVPFAASKCVARAFTASSSGKKNFAANLNCKRPPVILVNDPKKTPQTLTEVTFGFEVNQQLLECDNAVSNVDSVKCFKSLNLTRPPHGWNAIDLRRQIQCARDITVDNVVNFVKSAWDKVVSDVAANRAKYYDGQ